MQYEQVTEYNGIKVGDLVCVVEESGFQAGKPQYKHVRDITTIRLTEEESRRIGDPMRGVVWGFDSGTASEYDRVRKASPDEVRRYEEAREQYRKHIEERAVAPLPARG